MIERLSDMPPGTIGFRVTGEVQREDYDQVLVPELDRAVASGDGGLLKISCANKVMRLEIHCARPDRDGPFPRTTTPRTPASQ